MPCYRVELELRSGLGTPLAADTLWGHIAWGIRYHQGNQALEDWLAAYDGPDPPLVLSDPLPSGFFPRPALPPATPPDKPPGKEEADRLKRLNKQSWIAREAWLRIAADLSPHSLQQAIEHTSAPPSAQTMAVTRAGVNRLTGGTAQPEGGTLFTLQQSYFSFHRPPRFDVWCCSPHPADQVRRWFAEGVAGGYGRDASAGLGHLVVLGIQPAELPSPPDPNACVLLGPAVPRAADPPRGFFKLGTRCGRLGGLFAVGPLPQGASTRQKRPVRVLQAGTLLLAPEGVPSFVGRVLREVHPQIQAIRHYGLAPVLPCRLSHTLLDHYLLADVSEPLPAPSADVPENLRR